MACISVCVCALVAGIVEANHQSNELLDSITLYSNNREYHASTYKSLKSSISAAVIILLFYYLYVSLISNVSKRLKVCVESYVSE